jgi:8-oxo-dGTP diphosphatase
LDTARQERRIAVYGVCRDLADRVALVPSADAWRLPGGPIRHGERPDAAVVRLVGAATGLAVSVSKVREVLSDVIEADDGAVVQHDRVVYDMSIARSASEPGPARWFTPDELATARLLPYTAAVLRAGAVGAIETDLDAGGGAVDIDQADIDQSAGERAGGPRPRVQRFAVYALASDPAGRVLLTRIARGYPGAGRWHLPGGGTDFGEEPVAGLLRELIEETGQVGRVEELIAVSHRHHSAAVGWEGYPIDWQTVRAIYRVAVDEPSEPRVTETNGSTAAAAWFTPDGLDGTVLTEVAGAALADFAPWWEEPQPGRS